MIISIPRLHALHHDNALSGPLARPRPLRDIAARRPGRYRPFGPVAVPASPSGISPRSTSPPHARRRRRLTAHRHSAKRTWALLSALILHSPEGSRSPAHHHAWPSSSSPQRHPPTTPQRPPLPPGVPSIPIIPSAEMPLCPIRHGGRTNRLERRRPASRVHDFVSLDAPGDGGTLPGRRVGGVPGNPPGGLLPGGPSNFVRAPGTWPSGEPFERLDKSSI